MAQFSVNPSRFDSYKNFKFRVKWDGRYVAGIGKVSALKRTTEVVKHREGGDGRRSAASSPAGLSSRRDAQLLERVRAAMAGVTDARDDRKLVHLGRSHCHARPLVRRQRRHGCSLTSPRPLNSKEAPRRASGGRPVALNRASFNVQSS